MFGTTAKFAIAIGLEAGLIGAQVVTQVPISTDGATGGASLATVAGIATTALALLAYIVRMVVAGNLISSESIKQAAREGGREGAKEVITQYRENGGRL